MLLPFNGLQLLDHLLCRHVKLFFGQHLSVLVGCVLYVTAKYFKLSLSFKQIIQVGKTAVILPAKLSQS